MSNGLVTTLVATVVGVATALVMSRLLGEQPAVVREPIAQGIGLVAAWLCVWPWMRVRPVGPRRAEDWSDWRSVRGSPVMRSESCSA